MTSELAPTLPFTYTTSRPQIESVIPNRKCDPKSKVKCQIESATWGLTSIILIIKKYCIRFPYLQRNEVFSAYRLSKERHKTKLPAPSFQTGREDDATPHTTNKLEDVKARHHPTVGRLTSLVTSRKENLIHGYNLPRVNAKKNKELQNLKIKNHGV